MPVTSSAKKALRRDQRRQANNYRMRERLRTTIKDFEAEPKTDKLPDLYAIIDRAAKKTIIHKNKAARLKSRYTKMLKIEDKKAPVTKSKVATKKSS